MSIDVIELFEINLVHFEFIIVHLEVIEFILGLKH